MSGHDPKVHSDVIRDWGAVAGVVDERAPDCVEAWPDCVTFGYDPACCRFPKSCSAGRIRLVPVKQEEETS